jgi:threonine aldolase
MTKIIDLRSDTVTTPTERMREAMKDAAVGDDVLYEDPTVRKLEEMGAELFGKEQGLLTVSGTMSNQVAVLSLCKKGDQPFVPRPRFRQRQLSLLASNRHQAFGAFFEPEQ